MRKQRKPRLKIITWRKWLYEKSYGRAYTEHGKLYILGEEVRFK